MNRLRKLLVAVLSLGLAAMASGETPPASSLERHFAEVENAERRDLVKYQMQLGLAAFQAGDIDTARNAFEFVLSDIESLFSDSEEATKARSLWYEEGRKSFKGEPYERAMAYYYRGLIYLIDGEPDNARAAFLSGQLQDAFAEEDQHRTDFALLMLMEAWSARLMGAEQLAEAALVDFAVLRPEMKLPSPETHALFLVETGKGPRKIRDGISGENLVYRRGKRFRDKFVDLESEHSRISLEPTEDLFYQATTRGNRVIDRINKGKAEYKSSWSDTGTSVANLANQLTLFDNLGRDYTQAYSMENGVQVEYSSSVNYGAISIGASALTLLSSKIRPKADDRYWNNLPDTIHVGFLPKEKLSDGNAEQIILYDGSDNKLDTLPIKGWVVDDSYSLYWRKVH